MATDDKRVRRVKAQKRKEEGAQETGKESEGSGEPEEPKSIREGIYLSALIYVEGEQAPTEDFSPVAKAALRKALANEPEGISMALKKVEVKNDVEAEEEVKRPLKFEF
jgi:hypothetical protein